MQINFKTKKLAKLLNSSRQIEKHYGTVMAKKIQIRLKEMSFAKNLEEIMLLPGRHHPLTGNKKGLFACDLEHPYRLMYKPDNSPLHVNKYGSTANLVED